MSFATELATWAAGYRAWGLPAYYKAALVRESVNQHGRTLRFNDGSAIFIPKGYPQGAQVR